VYDCHAHSEPLFCRVKQQEQVLADKLSMTWTTFARTGNPSNKLIPTWTAHNTQQRPTMVLDDEPKLVNDPLKESRVAIGEMRAKYLNNT
jgi:carboxylesterase type B